MGIKVTSETTKPIQTLESEEPSLTSCMLNKLDIALRTDFKK